MSAATLPANASDALTMTGAEVVLRALKDQGVDVIFGYPGGAVLPIYDALFQQNAIRHILVRHEQAAVHAAEGYARSTGKVGCVLVTAELTTALLHTALRAGVKDVIPAPIDQMQLVDTVGRVAGGLSVVRPTSPLLGGGLGNRALAGGQLIGQRVTLEDRPLQIRRELFHPGGGLIEISGLSQRLLQTGVELLDLSPALFKQCRLLGGVLIELVPLSLSVFQRNTQLVDALVGFLDVGSPDGFLRHAGVELSHHLLILAELGFQFHDTRLSSGSLLGRVLQRRELGYSSANRGEVAGCLREFARGLFVARRSLLERRGEGLGPLKIGGFVFPSGIKRAGKLSRTRLFVFESRGGASQTFFEGIQFSDPVTIGSRRRNEGFQLGDTGLAGGQQFGADHIGHARGLRLQLAAHARQLAVGGGQIGSRLATGRAQLGEFLFTRAQRDFKFRGGSSLLPSRGQSGIRNGDTLCEFGVLGGEGGELLIDRVDITERVLEEPDLFLGAQKIPLQRDNLVTGGSEFGDGLAVRGGRGIPGTGRAAFRFAQAAAHGTEFQGGPLHLGIELAVLLRGDVEHGCRFGQGALSGLLAGLDFSQAPNDLGVL